MMTADCGRPRCRLIKHDSPEYHAAVALRNEILRKPIGLLLTDDQIRAEHADYHLACFAEGRLAGCLVLTPEAGGKLRMRQVAVAADCRRQGVGSALVRCSEEFAVQHGYREVYAHARETAVPFYEKLGYTAAGGRFIEVGLPHCMVRKALKANRCMKEP